MRHEMHGLIEEGPAVLNGGFPGWLLPFWRGCEARVSQKRLKRRCGEEGASLVEFAFSAAVMISLLFGVLETCLAVYSYDFTSEAARDAVRYAIVRGSNCNLETGAAGFNCEANNDQIQSHVRGLGYPGIDSSKIYTTTTWYTVTSGPTAWTTWCSTNTFKPVCGKPGNAVQVEVDYTFPLNIPFVPKKTINMANTSMMVISN